MASSETFASGLNKWRPEDMPVRQDFVADNGILDGHIGNKNNPHAVTAAQAGALAVNATAADSAKLGGVAPAGYALAGHTHPVLDEELANLGSVVQAIKLETLKTAFPVGSFYMSRNGTNPAGILGFGTWRAAFAGKSPVGVNAADTDFNAAGKTGGAKAVALDISQIPSHNHKINLKDELGTLDTADSNTYHTHAFNTTTTMTNDSHVHTLTGSAISAGGHTHNISYNNNGATTGSTAYPSNSGSYMTTGWTKSSGEHTHQVTGRTDVCPMSHAHNLTGTTSGNNVLHKHPFELPNTISAFTGNGGSHNNMHPYETVYYWERTA